MEGTINLAPIDERTRVLNVLQMYENGSLHNEGERIPVLALMCKTVLDIRRLNRKFVDKINERSWHGFDDSDPAIGDEILIRIDDASGIHVELMEWTDDDENYFDTDSVGVLWMKLPGIE